MKQNKLLKCCINKSCYPECRCGISGLIDFLVNQIPVCITSETMLVERNKLNKKKPDKRTKMPCGFLCIIACLFILFYFIKSPNSYVIPVMIGDKNDIKLNKHIALKSRG